MSQSIFHQTEKYLPKNDKENRLVKAFASLKSKEDVANFLRDLLTIAEIEEFANRLEMVRLLVKGHSYLKIAKETGASTTTVTRVAYWLNHGCGGYKRVIDILK